VNERDDVALTDDPEEACALNESETEAEANRIAAITHSGSPIKIREDYILIYR
jgi:hypothetical protein